MKKPKVAIFHFFLTGTAVGGAERMMIDLKSKLGCDFWVGGIDSKSWNGENLANPFVRQLFESEGQVHSLHEESNLPVWRVFKRFWFQRFSPKIKSLNQYDLILYNFTNIFFTPQKVAKNTVQVGYCNCPPRYATDQFSATRSRIPFLLRPAFTVYCWLIMYFWKQAFMCMDYTIANSENIKKRLIKHTGITVDKVLFPPVDTNRFKWLGQGDYFISYARLESMKRIELILEAFKNLPDKKLVICSGGPLENYVKEFIKEHDLKNITFEGRVYDERLAELVGNCLAGIYIPIEEDAGMTQVEIMAAGKPVLGVAEGGLLETVIDGKTGILIPQNPNALDVETAVQKMTPKFCLQMQATCANQAKKFDQEIFFKEIEAIIQAKTKS